MQTSPRFAPWPWREQVLLGQFWAEDSVQDYLAGLPDVDPLT